MQNNISGSPSNAQDNWDACSTASTAGGEGSEGGSSGSKSTRPSGSTSAFTEGLRKLNETNRYEGMVNSRRSSFEDPFTRASRLGTIQRENFLTDLKSSIKTIEGGCNLVDLDWKNLQKIIHLIGSKVAATDYHGAKDLDEVQQLRQMYCDEYDRRLKEQEQQKMDSNKESKNTTSDDDFDWIGSNSDSSFGNASE